MRFPRAFMAAFSNSDGLNGQEWTLVDKSPLMSMSVHFVQNYLEKFQ